MAASDSCVSNLYADALAASLRRRNPAWRDVFWNLVILFETCLDFLAAAGCTFIVFTSRIDSAPAGAPSLQRLAIVSLAGGMAAALSVRSVPVRRWSSALVPIWETERILRATICYASFVFLLGFLPGFEIRREALLPSLILIPASLIGIRQIFASIIRAFSARGYGLDRVVIYGAADTARQIASTLMQAPRHGLCPVALVLDEEARPVQRLFRPGNPRLRRIPVTDDPISPSLLHSFRCDLLIVAAPRLCAQQVSELANMAEQARSAIAILHDPGDLPEWIDIGGVGLLSNVQPVATWHFGFLKRTADLALSLALLILLAPLMLLIAFLISVDSRGPVLFMQDRVGKNGRLFPIFKFRSMHVTAPAYECSPTESDDPRVTRMGRLLRRAGLDELPQLFNVLLGHMSLVGPRPEMPFLVERYREKHRERLQVSPGITGLWQLSAHRGLPIHDNTQYDLYYIRNRTLCMDWAILIHTLFFAIRGGL